MDIDEEWENFISSETNDSEGECHTFNKQNVINNNILYERPNQEKKLDAPKPGNIYISTKTKIAYLNVENIQLNELFWKIKIIDYYTPLNGIIKKEMKFNSTNKDDYENMLSLLKNEKLYEEYVITHIDNPNGRVKFKDIRKITIGLSKKDIMSYRCKKKSAFYNCCVVIIRMKIENIFKEFHVKIFNTGKLEVPGVQTEESFYLLLDELVKILQPYIDDKLSYNTEDCKTVLINSNFNCGFYINRETLHDILKFKYNIQTMFDPCCSYPGVQSRFYYNPDVNTQDGCFISKDDIHIYPNVKQISFMIFRTGSVLIAGKCGDVSIIYEIYEFLKKLLVEEYSYIHQKMFIDDEKPKSKNKKIRKKYIINEC